MEKSRIVKISYLHTPSEKSSLRHSSKLPQTISSEGGGNPSGVH